MPAERDRSLSYHAVQTDDFPLLAHWLEQPHWREWWGDPAEELAMIRDMVEGRDPHCKPFLFHVEGEPVGYIQVWAIGPHQTPPYAAESPWLMELPADAVGVDLSIGEASRLSQGLGSRALQGFAQRLRSEGHGTIIIDPDPDNARAVAAYRKAGFQPVPHLEGRTDGVLIMQFQEDFGAR